MKISHAETPPQINEIWCNNILIYSSANGIILNAINVNETDSVLIKISASDADNDTLSYSLNPIIAGASFNNSTGDLNWMPDYSQAGSYDLVFSVSDGNLSQSQTISIVVVNKNRAPILSEPSNYSVLENQTISFRLNAADPDSDAINYSIAEVPQGAVLNSTSGEFSWQVLFNQSGKYILNFTATDSYGFSDCKSASIDVNDTGNHLPGLMAIGNKTLAEGSTLIIELNASDIDFDSLSYACFNAPGGAVFNYTTGIFSWTPNYSQAGNYSSIKFEVNDGKGGIVSENITIIVTNTNQPPVLQTIGNKQAEENALLEFTISATDADNDILSYSASNLPSGAEFNNATKRFSWTPSNQQLGSHMVTFYVSDGNLSDSETININVVDKCIPNWICTSWRACINGVRERECADSNYCGIIEGMPLEAESCPILPLTAQNSGGSASAKKGDGSTNAKITLTYQNCTEEWVCTEWSSCYESGVMSRECVDKKMCGTNNTKPETIRNCEYTAQLLSGEDTAETPLKENASSQQGGIFSLLTTLTSGLTTAINLFRNVPAVTGAAIGLTGENLGEKEKGEIAETGSGEKEPKNKTIVLIISLFSLSAVCLLFYKSFSHFIKKKREKHLQKYWYKTR